MADNLLTAQLSGTQTGGRPPHLPDELWDPATNQVRTEALLKAYLDMQARQGASVGAGADHTQLLKQLGVPDGPDGYAIQADHGLFEADPEINARLHAAGFTPDQAQLVYDLAAERFVPLVQEIAAGFEAERQLQRLIEHFGGEDKWRETSRQLLAWANKNLPPAAVEGLASTADGILALHKLMQSGEPTTLRGGTETATGEEELRSLMRDPRYWRDKNPDVVARVTQGFEKLYPGGR